LHIAAHGGHKEIVELLIAKGADVNAKQQERIEIVDTGGWTPLHHAAIEGHKEVAELLIAKGADMDAKNVDGETPLDLAIEENHTETTDLLRKHGGKTREELKAEGK
jgi:ankyrin repeat protein